MASDSDWRCWHWAAFLARQVVAVVVETTEGPSAAAAEAAHKIRDWGHKVLDLLGP